MTLSIVADTFRGARRWRLLFSGPPSSGAFTSTSYYVVTSADNISASPNVEAVFAIATNPNTLEVSVDSDFTPGAQYTLAVTGMPAPGGAVTASITDRVASPVQATPANTEPEQSDLDDLLYGVDIVWNGQDIVEGSNGDLATVSGQSNFQGAIARRMASDGLTWDGSYGAKADQFVDAPSLYARPLAGLFLGQAQQDDRTQTASIGVMQDPNDNESWWFALQITGKDGLALPSIPLPALPPT